MNANQQNNILKQDLRRRVKGLYLALGVVALMVGLAGCAWLHPLRPANNAVEPSTSLRTTDHLAAWPTEKWQTATPESQGMDSENLARLFAEIEAEQHAIDSVIVTRNGYLVAEAYIQPFQPGARHIVHSCTKSVVSALIGIAIEQGYLAGVDQPVSEIYQDRVIPNLDAQKQAMTLEHLLTMTSGFDCRDSYLYRWQGLDEMRQSKDWVQHMLNLPMIAQPGTRFEYCNGVSFLLSAIISQTTDQSALEFARENLFDPMGISDVYWPANPQGIQIGWGELHMRPLDMAKFGYLYLNEGQWDGTQIVPVEWVRASTQKYIDATLQDGYGYQWWVAHDKLFMALGYAGQFIFVLPEQSLVVVFTSHLEEQDFYTPQHLLEDYILPAVQSDEPLVENPDGLLHLNDQIERLAQPLSNPISDS